MPFVPDQQQGFVPDGFTPDSANDPGIWNSVVGGIQSSATGLYFLGRLPDVQLDPSHMTWYEKALSGAAQTLTDLPLMMGSFAAGATVGSEMSPIGSVIVGGAASFEVPTLIRESLVKAYRNGDAASSADWLSRAGIVIKGAKDPEIQKAASKAALVGGLTSGVGSLVGKTAAPYIGTTGAAVAQSAAEIGTMTVTPAALEGKLPEPQDFLNAAILVGGLRAAGHVVGKIADLYAKTGIRPEQVAADAKANPSIAETLLQGGMPQAYKEVEAAENAKAAMSNADIKPDYLAPQRPLQTVETSLGTFMVDSNHDVPALGSSTVDGTVLRDKDWNPMAMVGGRMLDRTPYLVEHEVVERAKELEGMDYKQAHADFAEPAEHAKLLQDYGLKPGTPEAEKLIQEYEASYKDDIAKAAAKVKAGRLDIHPNMIVKPYGHPDNQLEKEDLEAVLAAQKNPVNSARAMMEKPFGDIPQQPGEPKVDLYPNFDYINSPDDIKAALARAFEVYGKKIEEQTRGKVSWAQQEQEASSALAEMLGNKDASLMGRKPGTGAGTTEMRIRKAMLMSAVEDFTRKARAYNPLTSSPQAAIEVQAAAERVGMMSAYFQGAASEAGRALQALQDAKMGMAQSQAVMDLFNQHGGDIAKVAEAMQDVDNPVAAAGLARQLAAVKTSPILPSLYRFSLLLGFKVPQVKLIGDGIATASAIIDRYVAAGVSKIDFLSKGDKTRLGEANAFLSGMVKSSGEALKVAKATWRSFAKPQGTEGPLEGHPNVFGVKNGIPAPEGSAASFANKTLAIPSRVIAAETEMIRTLNERGQLHAEAYNQAVKEGLAPGTREFASRLYDIAQNPGKDIEAAMKKAGDEATFTAKLGAVGQALQKLSDTTRGSLVLPFVKIPTNLVKWAVRRTPGLAAVLDDVRTDIKAGGRARDLAIARQVIGAAVVTAAYGAVKGGTLTGGGLYLTPEQRQAKMDAGWQPYSIKSGDTYYSCARFDPLARIAAVAADAAEINEHLEEDDRANLPAMIGAAFGSALVSQTYLENINSVMEALKDPNREGPKGFDNFVGSWIPSFLGQLASAEDPYKRKIDGVMDELKYKIPGLRKTLPPQINALTGEPLQNNIGLTSVNVSDISKDPILQEAARLQIGVSRPPKTLSIRSLDKASGKVQLTPEQQEQFSTVAGHMAHQAMSSIVGTQEWEELPDLIKKKVFEMALTNGRKVANAQALSPEQRADEAERIAAEISKELQ